MVPAWSLHLFPPIQLTGGDLGMATHSFSKCVQSKDMISNSVKTRIHLNLAQRALRV